MHREDHSQPRRLVKTEFGKNFRNRNPYDSQLQYNLLPSVLGLQTDAAPTRIKFTTTKTQTGFALLENNSRKPIDAIETNVNATEYLQLISCILSKFIRPSLKAGEINVEGERTNTQAKLDATEINKATKITKSFRNPMSRTALPIANGLKIASIFPYFVDTLMTKENAVTPCVEL